ncbi:hypothetical protein BDZ91DRAFT_837744 [Kalaharituber pfeilii]|nr:hypothetical protein BDZ91DRAFT_837744 [Kalaharituber pfeilii]
MPVWVREKKRRLLSRLSTTTQNIEAYILRLPRDKPLPENYHYYPLRYAVPAPWEIPVIARWEIQWPLDVEGREEERCKAAVHIQAIGEVGGGAGVLARVIGEKGLRMEEENREDGGWWMPAVWRRRRVWEHLRDWCRVWKGMGYVGSFLTEPPMPKRGSNRKFILALSTRSTQCGTMSASIDACNSDPETLATLPGIGLPMIRVHDWLSQSAIKAVITEAAVISGDRFKWPGTYYYVLKLIPPLPHLPPLSRNEHPDENKALHASLNMPPATLPT